MKTLTIKVAGTTGEPTDVQIQAGTTAGEILRQLGLEGYLLSKDAAGGRFFGEDENVYPDVGDGEKLFATAKTEVGEGREPSLTSQVTGTGDGGSTPPSVPAARRLVIIRPEGRAKKQPVAIRRVVKIERSREPYWKERGWRKRVKQYRGFYRTQFGSFEGKIIPGICNPKFYIKHPPRELHSHSHWACFNHQGGGWWFIHFSEPSSDIDSGILKVERLIHEAFRQAG